MIKQSKEGKNTYPTANTVLPELLDSSILDSVGLTCSLKSAGKDP